MGGQANMVLKSVVTGWCELVATLRQERIMEKLKEENLAYKAKSDESMRRAMSMMMGGQANMVLKSVVTGWCELLATLRQERIMEKLKEENLAYKAKSDESMRRAMSMMMG